MLDDSVHSEMVGRFLNYTLSAKAVTDGAGGGYLNPEDNWDIGATPVLLGGLRVDRFQAVFRIDKTDTFDRGYSFVFGALDQNHYHYVTVHHRETPTAPVWGGLKVSDAIIDIQASGAARGSSGSWAGRAESAWAGMRIAC